MARKMKSKKVVSGDGNNGKSESKKQEKQVKWIIIGMILVLLIVILVYFVIQESKKFDYAGLRFEKIMFDKLLLYHGKIPIISMAGNVIANYNLYLRNDPRKLENIKINGNIRLTQKVIVSLDNGAEKGCSDAGIAGANFFSFLKAAGLNVGVAYINQTYARERNGDYVICSDSGNESVIIIKQSKENKITQEKNNCYVIEFKECDILKATERFMIGIIAHSKGTEV